MTTTRVPEALSSAVRDGNRFLLTSHISPDGDAIGSCLGMARILRRLAKGAVIWLRDEPPGVYAPLPGFDRIHVGTEPPAGFPEAFDGTIALECPSLERSGLHESLSALKVLNIDHHLGNEQYGDVNWVDTGAPSLGAMLFQLARALRVELDADTANCLYLTIATDTGGFRFSNATTEAFEAAAALVREGAEPERVAQWIYESQPESALRLLGAMLGTLERHGEDRKVATVVLDRAMFEATGAHKSDSEGLVDYPRSIAGVEAVGLLREIDGGWKVSLRSRGAVDVEQIARRHSGGGHKNAAGFEVELGRDAALSLIVDELRAALGG
jgi:phosphoesterase RecJ-like protein